LLEREGIISKAKHPESKAKILYQLTSKGIDLVPVLVEIIAWSKNTTMCICPTGSLKENGKGQRRAY